MLKIGCPALVTESVTSHAARVHQRRPCEHRVEDHGRGPALRARAPPQVCGTQAQEGRFADRLEIQADCAAHTNKQTPTSKRQASRVLCFSPTSCLRCSLTVPAVRTSCFAVVVGLCSFCHSLVTQQAVHCQCHRVSVQLCCFFSCTLLRLSAPERGVETLARAPLWRAPSSLV